MTFRSSKDEPRLKTTLGVLSFTVFLDLVGFGMILPLLPFYAERFGASSFQVGLLFASYSLAQFVCSPLWGGLSDRLGRRRLLLASIFGGCIAYLLFAAAQGLVLLFIARTLAGAAAANYTIAQAYIADITRPEERAKTMGWLGAAFGLGFVFGPALGAALSHWGAVAVPLGAAALTGANFCLVWLQIPEPESRRRKSSKSAPGGRLLPRIEGASSLPALLALYAAVILGFSAMEATLALLCEERLAFGIRETSWLFVFVGVLIVLVQAGLIGRLVARFGEGRILLAGLLIMAAGLMQLAGVDTIRRLLVATAFLAVGSGLFNPTSLGLMSRLTPADSQGGVLGFARSLGALARVAGPVWGGWSFQHLGSPWPFLSAGSLMIVSALVTIRLLPRFWIQLRTAD